MRCSSWQHDQTSRRESGIAPRHPDGALARYDVVVNFCGVVQALRLILVQLDQCRPRVATAREECFPPRLGSRDQLAFNEVDNRHCLWLRSSGGRGFLCED